MGRARGLGAGNLGVLLRGDRRDLGGVVSEPDEGGHGHLVAAHGVALGGQVVNPVRSRVGPDAEKVGDSLRQVLREGRTALLIMDHGGLDAAPREVRHGLNEVVAVAKDPRRAHNVVLRACRCRRLARCLRRAVGRQRGGNLVFRVYLVGAVEDVVRGDVDEREIVVGGHAGELARGQGVDGPGARAVGLRAVDVVIRRTVDDGGVLLPIARRVRGVIRDIELGMGDELCVGKQRAQRASELAVGAGDEDAAWGHGGGIGKLGMGEVFLGDLGGLEGPINHVEVDCGVARVRRPVCGDEVGVRRVVLEGLEAVGDAARDEDGCVGADLGGDELAVSL